jgi:hypothetical protein
MLYKTEIHERKRQILEQQLAAAIVVLSKNEQESEFKKTKMKLKTI